MNEKELTSLEKALCDCESLSQVSDSNSQSNLETSVPSNKTGTDSKANNETIQHLFVSISKVADQLQSNYPRDFRAIMKQAYTFTLSKPGEGETEEERSRRAAKLRDRFDMPSDCMTFDLSLTTLMALPAESKSQILL